MPNIIINTDNLSKELYKIFNNLPQSNAVVKNKQYIDSLLNILLKNSTTIESISRKTFNKIKKVYPISDECLANTFRTEGAGYALEFMTEYINKLK